MALIKRCGLCGETKFKSFRKRRMELNYCMKCGSIHQIVKMSETQYNQFYEKDYHDKHQKDLGRQSYKERYNHDIHIGQARLQKYSHFIPYRGKLLDVGSGNGAFVDLTREMGYTSYGVDYVNHKWTYYGSLNDVKFPTEYFDVVTIHDVLEHFVDPLKTLKEARRVLKPGGRLIVDFPNYFSEAGKHHWRPIQHLWYFTEPQVKELLEKAGFYMTEVDYPIASKMVFYAYNSKSSASDTKILLLPGMGDIYWVLTKLESFMKENNITLPQVYVWDFDGRPRSLEFLQKFPFVKAAGYWRGKIDHKLLYDTYTEDRAWMVPNYQGFDYYFSANGFLHMGKSLEDIDEYKTDWYVPRFETMEEVNYGKEFRRENGKYIVAFFSEMGMFAHWIKHLNFIEIHKMLKAVYEATGHKIILTGCHWDRSFNDKLLQMNRDEFLVDMVGKTSSDDLFGMIKASKGMIGWCGGNTIMATIFKKPTIMFWSEYFKDPNFYTNSCPPESLGKWYFPLKVEDFNLSEIIKIAKENFNGKPIHTTGDRGRILGVNENPPEHEGKGFAQGSFF